MPESLSADHWRARAREARELAQKMTDDESKARMLNIALDYEKIADRAEHRRPVQRHPEAQKPA